MADLGKVLHFTDANFDAEVIQSTLPVLVDFTATWCGPCRALAPILEELAVDYIGRVKVGKVDVDQCPKTAAAYRILSVPTLLVFKNGKVAAQWVGATSKTKVAAMLEKVLG